MKKERKIHGVIHTRNGDIQVEGTRLLTDDVYRRNIDDLEYVMNQSTVDLTSLQKAVAKLGSDFADNAIILSQQLKRVVENTKLDWSTSFPNALDQAGIHPEMEKLYQWFLSDKHALQRWIDDRVKRDSIYLFLDRKVQSGDSRMDHLFTSYLIALLYYKIEMLESKSSWEKLAEVEVDDFAIGLFKVLCTEMTDWVDELREEDNDRLADKIVEVKETLSELFGRLERKGKKDETQLQVISDYHSHLDQ